MKGQAAIMDALIFMLVASGAATLLLFVAGIYSSSTNTQITTIYNYEYGGNALIALHYAKDEQGKWFWNELKNKLLSSSQADVEDYLNGDAKYIWQNITASSPAGQNTALCFQGAAFSTGQAIPCYPFSKPEPVSTTIYTSSVKITPDINVIIKLYY